jgi:hypothetical protein
MHNPPHPGMSGATAWNRSDGRSMLAPVAPNMQNI